MTGHCDWTWNWALNKSSSPECCWQLIFCISWSLRQELWWNSLYASSRLEYWKHALLLSHVRIIHAHLIVLFPLLLYSNLITIWIPTSRCPVKAACVWKKKNESESTNDVLYLVGMGGGLQGALHELHKEESGNLLKTLHFPPHCSIESLILKAHVRSTDAGFCSHGCWLRPVPCHTSTRSGGRTTPKGSCSCC